ncbi:dimethyl sulfoxide reductase anchor subunit family protein [Sagittula salina]|uniref:Dimethyl sulfoxide reductase anchor subunit n=1 Tax=Sagittula salina TaxID=2820268 RepID=A0A940MWV5_9RHOB|nr:DmsC/YnfH family molybdoenzyme membrane anchor subunit [Sagittula salina]MBP0484349.1 dimethyl sulfoxide reductase anchor subunit [Sagittula salina]
MHPAPSLIAFTVASGLGFGLLFWLGIDATPPSGWVGLAFYLIAYALALAGLGASTRHLGRPERALKAFTQWRSSWLSREAWAAVAALSVNAFHAAGLVFFDLHLPALGWLGAALALGTVFATSMIYAQLRTVPRWHHWSTPVLFLLYAVTGGALLSGRVEAALVLLTVTGAAQGAVFLHGDRRLARAGTTLSTATGLPGPRAFAPPHTGPNYLTREMAFSVARRHAEKLRLIALALGALLPALLLLLPFHHSLGLVALLSHVAGGITARWLFFAEAEHVMSLYYGKSQRT